MTEQLVKAAVSAVPPPAANDKIVLSITAGLAVPKDPLPSVSTQEYLSRKDLIDPGGMSIHPEEERLITEGHANGFISAITTAFAYHYPLALRPQHFWLLICQAVSTHVDLNAEAVRQHWVTHEGKKELEVRCNEFVLHRTNDWASTVSGKPDSFATQIEKNTVAGVCEVLSPSFSDTSSIESIAQKIVVMDICKNYFSYRCSTMCGFPEITMEGTEQDWHLLRGAAERLLQRCEPVFAAKWAEALLPLLDKLAAARSDGAEVDAQFWNSMCKRGGTVGSGARTWFNGWFNIFFPYLDCPGSRTNIYCVPYRPDMGYVKEGLAWNKTYSHFGSVGIPEGVQGPDCLDFGTGMSCAPVHWDYYGTVYKLSFMAGFIGAAQDPVSLQIRPQIGWYITGGTK